MKMGEHGRSYDAEKIRPSEDEGGNEETINFDQGFYWLSKLFGGKENPSVYFVAVGSTYSVVAVCGGILAGLLLSLFHRHMQQEGAFERFNASVGEDTGCKSLSSEIERDEKSIVQIATLETYDSSSYSDSYDQRGVDTEAEAISFTTIDPQNEIKAEINPTESHQVPRASTPEMCSLENVAETKNTDIPEPICSRSRSRSGKKRSRRKKKEKLKLEEQMKSLSLELIDFMRRMKKMPKGSPEWSLSKLEMKFVIEELEYLYQLYSK